VNARAIAISAILVGVIVAIANLPAAAYSCISVEKQQQQHMNVFVISDDTGCAAELVKKGMLLPDPAGNKAHFPKNYDVTCFNVPSKQGANVFEHIENVTVPSLLKTTQERPENIEELYVFVYPPSLVTQFHEFIAARFGTERANMVDGWANVPKNTAFSPEWAAAIYHEGRHLSIHGTWHDDAGLPLPNNQISYYPGFGPSHNDNNNNNNNSAPVKAGLLRFLNIRSTSLTPSCNGGGDDGAHINLNS
jgi:hypothetical protein